GREQRVRRMRTSNQKASVTSVKLLMKHRLYLLFIVKRYAHATANYPIPLLVSMTVRAKHRMRYARTYIFVIGTDPRTNYVLGQVREPMKYLKSSVEGLRSKDNTSLHRAS
ncbi:hypothetical protein P692DRAFT_20743680, partial [Suillus brevipes Sb2]